MSEVISNDNEFSAGKSLPGPDAHGQAAMLLVESLLHGLVARSVLSVADACDIVGGATDVATELTVELAIPPATMEKSLTLLAAISTSLEHDLPDEEKAPPG